jgi:RNA-directed DNA polymerase
MRLGPAPPVKGRTERRAKPTLRLGMAMHQKSMQIELLPEDRGEAPNVWQSGEARSAAQGDERSGSGRPMELMERVVERENCLAAFKRVRKNKGSPGIDGMRVEDLPAYLRGNWERIRAELLVGSYRPSAVRRQEIPKSGGGMRQLGIPTVLDRFIQQAVLQVLQPIFDSMFSEHSYGFRPGRRAHDAVCQAQRYVQSGRRWVVDVDLEKFFDRVNHDVLMARLEKRIGDRRLLRVIRRYLEAGVLADGVVVERHEGTPQGGPLSPLLANVLLDEVDRKLERSGHAFVRYADDCNVYVRSKRAGERVMERLRKLYARLRLKINEDKSTVARAWDRKFLGYSFWVGRGREVRRRVAPKALTDFKERIRQITSRNGGRSLGKVVEELRMYLLGWKAYFRLADTPGVFHDLDQWIARRLRMVQLKQWKRGRTAYREMRTRGVPDQLAAVAAKHTRSWWRLSRHGALQTALPGRLFEQMGLPRLRPH